MITSKKVLSNSQPFIIDKCKHSDSDYDAQSNKRVISYRPIKSLSNACSHAKIETSFKINTDCAKPVLSPISTESPINSLENKDSYDNLSEKQRDHIRFVSQVKNMEQARFKLFMLLTENHSSLCMFAKQYLSELKQGHDQSEMLLFNHGKSNSKAVQNNNTVQLNAKQLETRLTLTLQEIILSKNESDLEFVLHIHFLPAFLQQVASTVINDAEIDTGFKSLLIEQMNFMTTHRELIVQNNLGLVTFVANKYNHNKIAFADLIQEGTIGLIKAVDRFDVTRSVKFSTYAVYWIRQTICRCITRQKNTIRLPFNLAPTASEVFDVINASLEQSNQYPSSFEIAELCQLSVREVETILVSYQPCISLTTHVNNDQEMPVLIDTLEQNHFPSPFNNIARSGLQLALKQAINSLPKREAYVLSARYGLNNAMELTLQDLADQFQISCERVRQIQYSALRRIKAKYSAELKDFLTPEPFCTE